MRVYGEARIKFFVGKALPSVRVRWPHVMRPVECYPHS